MKLSPYTLLYILTVLQGIDAELPLVGSSRYDDRKDRRLDHRRRAERGEVSRRDVAHMPFPQGDVATEPHTDEVVLLRSSRDLAQQLNMTLRPPENKALAAIPRGSGSLLRSDMVNVDDTDTENDRREQTRSRPDRGRAWVPYPEDVFGGGEEKNTYFTTARHSIRSQDGHLSQPSRSSLRSENTSAALHLGRGVHLEYFDEEPFTATPAGEERARETSYASGSGEGRGARSDRVQPVRGQSFTRRAASHAGDNNITTDRSQPAYRRLRRGVGHKKAEKAKVGTLSQGSNFEAATV